MAVQHLQLETEAAHNQAKPDQLKHQDEKMDGQTKTNIPNTPKCCCFGFKQNRQEKYLTYLSSEVKIFMNVILQNTEYRTQSIVDRMLIFIYKPTRRIVTTKPNN